MENQEPELYNAIIVDSYLQYLNSQYPHVNTNEILEEANIMAWEAQDPGCWLTQKQINDFHKAIDRRVEHRGGVSLAREVGRFSGLNKAGKFLRQVAISMLTPENLYKRLNIITNRYLRNLDLTSKKLGSRKYELVATFREGVKPSKFQCENLMGTFEASIYIFHNKWPRMEHTHCYFRGDPFCRYVVTWHLKLAYLLKRLRNIIAILGTVAALTLLFAGNLKLSAAIVFGSIVAFFLAHFGSETAEKNDIIKAFQRQDLQSMDLTEGYSRFHDYTSYFAQLAKSFSSRSSIPESLEAFAKSLYELGCKKGAISIVEASKNKMRVKYLFGYGDKALDLPPEDENVEFKIPNPKQVGFIKYADLKDWLRKVVPNDMDMSNPIYIPMLYENSLIGFVIADYTRDESQVAVSDMSLIQAVASQMALVITNIMTFDAVRVSEAQKSEFFMIASHELRTPIQAITLAYDDLVGKLDDQIKNKHSRTLTTLEKAVERLDGIVEDLLNLGKLESKEKIIETRVMISDIFDQAQDDTAQILRSYGHDGCFDLNGDIQIICDMGLIVQVLTNLISNAAKFTPPGGTIIVKYSVRGAEIVIEVIDNGYGVETDEQEKIFFKFYQAKNTSIHQENDGCGLGLPFCSEAVKKHDGYISVESPLGPEYGNILALNDMRKGSAFAVHMPVERVVRATEKGNSHG